MNKILSKFLLGSIFTIPAVSLISCGTPEKDDFDLVTVKSIEGRQLKDELKVKDSVNNTKISVAVRASDKKKYDALAAKFNEYKKGQVSIEIMPELHMIETLQTRAATGNLPNLFLVDMNTMGEIVSTSSYVKPILMKEIFDKKNKDLYDIKSNQSSYLLSDFDKNELDFSSNKNGVQLAVPLGYSGASLMFNTTMIDKTKHIKSYVPIKNVDDPSLTPEEKVTGTKILKDSDGNDIDGGLATLDNIQYYIDQAGNSENAKNIKDGWLGWGVGNMFQRIYSVARSAMKEPQNSAAMSWKELYRWFPIWASGSKDGLLENKKLELKRFKDKYVTSDRKASKEFVDYLWNTFGGYTYIDNNIAGFSPSDALNGSKGDKGEVEPFQNKQQMFMINAMWALNFAEGGWSKYDSNLKHSLNYGFNKGIVPNFEDNKGTSSGQIKVLSLPYTSVSVADALSISDSSTTEESLVAKRFIKFLFDKDGNSSSLVSFEDNKTTITGSPAEIISSKFSSSNKIINNLLKQKRKGQDGWYNGGSRITSPTNKTLKSSDIYRGVSGTAWQLTSDNFFSQIETQIRANMQSFYGIGKENKAKWTYNEFKKLIDKTISDFMDQIDLS